MNKLPFTAVIVTDEGVGDNTALLIIGKRDGTKLSGIPEVEILCVGESTGED